MHGPVNVKYTHIWYKNIYKNLIRHKRASLTAQLYPHSVLFLKMILIYLSLIMLVRWTSTLATDNELHWFFHAFYDLYYTIHYYTVIYSMVQSPSWEANWFAASQEIPRISRNPKVHYRAHKRKPPVSIFGQPNPVHIPTCRSILILSTHLRLGLPHWSPSLRFPHQYPIHPPLLTHTRHMPSPSSSFFSILSPAQYWVSSTNNLAPRYAVPSIPPLPHPS